MRPSETVFAVCKQPDHSGARPWCNLRAVARRIAKRYQRASGSRACPASALLHRGPQAAVDIRAPVLWGRCARGCVESQHGTRWEACARRVRDAEPAPALRLEGLRDCRRWCILALSQLMTEQTGVAIGNSHHEPSGLVIDPGSQPAARTLAWRSLGAPGYVRGTAALNTNGGWCLARTRASVPGPCWRAEWLVVADKSMRASNCACLALGPALFSSLASMLPPSACLSLAALARLACCLPPSSC